VDEKSLAPRAPYVLYRVLTQPALLTSWAPSSHRHALDPLPTRKSKLSVNSTSTSSSVPAFCDWCQSLTTHPSAHALDDPCYPRSDTRV
jgi:hypothetical protein